MIQSLSSTSSMDGRLLPKPQTLHPNRKTLNNSIKLPLKTDSTPQRNRQVSERQLISWWKQRRAKRSFPLCYHNKISHMEFQIDHQLPSNWWLGTASGLNKMSEMKQCTKIRRISKSKLNQKYQLRQYLFNKIDQSTKPSWEKSQRYKRVSQWTTILR